MRCMWCKQPILRGEPFSKIRLITEYLESDKHWLRPVPLHRTCIVKYETRVLEIIYERRKRCSDARKDERQSYGLP